MIGAILVGGGMGRRLGACVPKAFVRLGRRTLVQHCVDRFAGCREVAQIVVVVPSGKVAACRRMLQQHSRTIEVVGGGLLRQDSVQCGLAALSAGCDIVLVHDVARPCVSPALIRRVAAAARRYGAAVPALPSRETLKAVSGPWVVETLDRARIAVVQTPQGYRRRWLERALVRAAAGGFHGSDDAALLERDGRRVRIVPGEAGNIKITWPEDIAVAQVCLAMVEKRCRGGSGVGKTDRSNIRRRV